MKNLMPTKSSRNFYNTNHDAKEIHSIVRRPRHTLFLWLLMECLAVGARALNPNPLKTASHPLPLS
jgi:hypothetical protein